MGNVPSADDGGPEANATALARRKDLDPDYGEGYREGNAYSVGRSNNPDSLTVQDSSERARLDGIPNAASLPFACGGGTGMNRPFNDTTTTEDDTTSSKPPAAPTRSNSAKSKTSKLPSNSVSTHRATTSSCAFQHASSNQRKSATCKDSNSIGMTKKHVENNASLKDFYSPLKAAVKVSTPYELYSPINAASSTNLPYYGDYAFGAAVKMETPDDVYSHVKSEDDTDTKTKMEGEYTTTNATKEESAWPPNDHLATTHPNSVGRYNRSRSYAAKGATTRIRNLSDKARRQSRKAQPPSSNPFVETTGMHKAPPCTKNRSKQPGCSMESTKYSGPARKGTRPPSDNPPHPNMNAATDEDDSIHNNEDTATEQFPDAEVPEENGHAGSNNGDPKDTDGDDWTNEYLSQLPNKRANRATEQAGSEPPMSSRKRTKAVAIARDRNPPTRSVHSQSTTMHSTSGRNVSSQSLQVHHLHQQMLDAVALLQQHNLSLAAHTLDAQLQVMLSVGEFADADSDPQETDSGHLKPAANANVSAKGQDMSGQSMGRLKGNATATTVFSPVDGGVFPNGDDQEENGASSDSLIPHNDSALSDENDDDVFLAAQAPDESAAVERNDDHLSDEVNNGEENPDADDPQETDDASDPLTDSYDSGPSDDDDVFPVADHNKGDPFDKGNNGEDVPDEGVPEANGDGREPAASDRAVATSTRQSEYSRRTRTRSFQNQESNGAVATTTRKASYSLRSKTQSSQNQSLAPIPGGKKAKKVLPARKHQKTTKHASTTMRRKEPRTPTSPKNTDYPYDFPLEDGDWTDDWFWWIDEWGHKTFELRYPHDPTRPPKKFRCEKAVTKWLKDEKSREGQNKKRQEARDARKAMAAEEEDDEETSAENDDETSE